MLSIIIPVYNAAKTIKLVLKALVKSKTKNSFEVILVDDGSADNSLEIISQFTRIQKFKLFCQKHQGPSVARNLGAKHARGDILVFVDADVILEPKTLARIEEDFLKNKDLVALNGVYSIKPANPSFFTWYFSLFKYYQWVYRKQKEYTAFSTRLAAIKKKIFLKMKGFGKQYKSALVEDYEFGHRLGKKYQVSVDPRVVGRHFHPGFRKCFSNYYQRVYLWLKLFGKRKQFDSITTTVSTGLGSAFGFLSLIFLPLLFLHSISFIFVLPFLGSLVIFLWFYRRFHFFVLKKKGFFWLLAAILTSLVLTIPIGLAAFKFLATDKLNL